MPESFTVESIVQIILPQMVDFGQVVEVVAEMADRTRSVKIREAAARLGVRQTLFCARADTVLLTHVKMLTGYRRFERADLERFKHEMSVGPARQVAAETILGMLREPLDRQDERRTAQNVTIKPAEVHAAAASWTPG